MGQGPGGHSRDAHLLRLLLRSIRGKARVQQQLRVRKRQVHHGRDERCGPGVVYQASHTLHGFMSKPVSRSAYFSAAVAAAALGCQLPAYEQPAPTAPHAIAKIRVANHSSPGPSLTEAMVLNDHSVELPSLEGDFLLPRTTSIRIRPEAAFWSMQTTFFHTYTTTTMETYSYGCGKTMCTGTRSVTHTYTAVDGSCKAGLAFRPVADHMYLLQYDFYGHEQCRLQCMEQQPDNVGGFQLTPCLARNTRPDD